MFVLIRYTYLIIFFLLASGLFAQGTLYWYGAGSSNDWAAYGNWTNDPMYSSPVNMVPDDNTDVVIDFTSLYMNGASIHINTNDNTNSISFKSLQVITTIHDTLIFELDSIEANGDITTTDQTYIYGSNGPTDLLIMDNCDLNIGGSNTHDMNIIVAGGAKVELTEDLIQEACVLVIDEGEFDTKNSGTSSDMDLNKILISSDPDAMLTQKFKANTSNITLRDEGNQLSGIGFLDGNATEFNQANITFDIPTSWNPDTVRTRVEFNMSGWPFNNITLKRPAKIEKAGQVNAISLLAGERYTFDGTLTIIDSIVQIWGNSPDSCNNFTYLMGHLPGFPAVLDVVGSISTLSYVCVSNIIGSSSKLILDNYVIDSSVTNFVFDDPITPRSYKWTGAAANDSWHSRQNWEDLATNQAATCLPTPADHVVFLSSSFSVAGEQVVISPHRNAYCQNMSWIDVGDPQFHIRGHLYVAGDFYLDEEMEFGVPASAAAKPSIIFTSDDSVNINPKGKDIPADVEFLGNHSASNFDLDSMLNVRELKISGGRLQGNKRKIIADRLLVEDNGTLFLDSGIIVIDSSSHIFEDNGSKYFDKASFDVKGELLSMGTTKVILKGEDVVFNGGDNFYGTIDFRGNGHIINSDGVTNIMNVLHLQNQKEYTIGVADSLVINNIMVHDTQVVGSNPTSLSANSLIRYVEDAPVYTPPAIHHATVLGSSGSVVCLQDMEINDVNIASLGGWGITGKCDTTNLTFTDPSLFPGGWNHSESCYYYLTGFAMDMRDSSEVFPGMASCFRIIPNNSNQIMFDTIEINYLDTSGGFLFTNLDTGSHYLIKIDPADTTLLPHYYPDNKLWSQADPVHLLSDTGGLLVEVSPMPIPPSGQFATKVITGSLSPSPGNAPQPLFNISSGYLRGPVDIEDSLIIGLFSLDPNNFGVVQTVYSNKNGFFKFVNVDTGYYKIHPDIAGIPVDTGHALATISVYETTDTASIELAVADSMIYPVSSVITSTDQQPEKKLLLWPNPVIGGLNIRSPYLINRIEFFDMMSRKVKTVIKDASEVYVDMNTLNPGIYLIYINGERIRQRIFKP